MPSEETILEALTGNYRPEHVFALRHALELYDVHQTKIAECAVEIEAILEMLNDAREAPSGPLPSVRHAKARNELKFEARPALYTLTSRAFTSSTSKPRASRISKTGIQ